ncbi:MAG: aminodeoxychorismate synthase component I [Vicinamibacterales bacterium]
MPSVLLRTPHRRPWLELREPAATLVAARPDEVAGVLEAAQHAADGGSLVAGFVAYEAAAAFDLAVHQPPTGLPLAWFGVFSPASAVTHETLPDFWRGAPGALHWDASVDEPGYAADVARIRGHIADGDTYQLNYTFRMRAPFDGDPRALFGSLVDAQQGPWSAFIDTGDFAICSASPELFFTREGDRIVTRPMKGTAPRGRWPEEDAARAFGLVHAPKDRAENVMIVDLMRNDLGRIARPGTVAVTSLFDAERYPAQWQMTSTVEARLREGVGLVDIFRALFPSGSVTGAPKVRSMGILRGVESSPRGVYCGAIGLIEPGGRAQFNVAIRTVTVDRTTARAEFGVGSGIVWDSEAGSEYEECRVKAAILTARAPAFELLESLRWMPGTGCRLLARHLARLQASAAYFGWPWDEASARRTLTQATAHLAGPAARPAKVRLLLNDAGAIRCDVQPLGLIPTPFRVALAAEPVSSKDVFLFHKTTRRQVYAAAEAGHPGSDAVILWNERGEVTEATRFNVVAEIDGERVTPPLDCGLLAGVMRAELLESGSITERRITVAELLAAPRLWVVNSVRGWVEASF